MKGKFLLFTAVLALLGTAALELTSHAAMTIATPKRSPSTGEAGNAILTDEGSRRLQIVGVIFPNSSGATALNSHVKAGKVSPVTGKEEPARYALADGTEVPLMALASIDTSTHTAKPLVLPAGNVTLAGDVTGPASASVVATVGSASAASVASAASYATAEKAIVAVADKPSGGAIGSAAATVDAARVFNCTQTTAAQTLTLPSPTTAGSAKVVYVYNSGSASFTLLGATVAAGVAQGALWNGTAWVAL